MGEQDPQAVGNRTKADHRAGHLRPGDWVIHPQQPDWGVGQVQSVAGLRVTVTFEHAGKILINATHVALEPLLR